VEVRRWVKSCGTNVFGALAAGLMMGSPWAGAVSDEQLALIELPDGFSVSVFAADVAGARSLALGDNGTIFVGTRQQGKVYALVDSDNDGASDEMYTLAEGLNQPNGVAFRDGALYVAEIHRLLRFDDIESKLANPGEPAVVYDDYPTDAHHGWKFIKFGPDGKLYVPVGAPGNTYLPEGDEIYCTITRMNPDGSEREIFAHGVRNTVGFDWRPSTGVLWFTDNGRDMMGDNIPPDELNRVPEAGMHFGHPFVHGEDILDPEFGTGENPSDYSAPALELGPHVAALGMRFYEGEMLPEEYRGQILIAEHGSWNRSAEAGHTGYRLMKVDLRGNRAVSYDVFAYGWLRDNQAWGRPVDIQELPDGSLLVSDDRANVVYRITYGG
jgi:glucose/arabinose dehydrogenase